MQNNDHVQKELLWIICIQEQLSVFKNVKIKKVAIA